MGFWGGKWGELTNRGGEEGKREREGREGEKGDDIPGAFGGVFGFPWRFVWG